MAKTTIKIDHKDGETIVSNGDVAWSFGGNKMLDETVIASLVFQTVYTKFKELTAKSDDFSIEFSMDIVINKEGEKDARMEMLDRPLSDFPLSVRTLAILRVNGITLVRDLVRLNKTDVRKFRNAGGRTVSEITDFLESHHLEWGMKV